MSPSHLPGEDGRADRPIRLSLRKIDALLLGELPEGEAAELRARIARDPEAQAYLERQAALRSGLTEAALREELRKRQAAGRPAGSLILGWRERWSGILGGLAGGRGKAMVALGALACLAVGLTLWTGRSPGPAEREAYRSKGATGFELAIRWRGTEYEPGEPIPARSGDTLILAYRGLDSLLGQIWIQEDEGEPVALEGRDLRLPPATAWTELPRRILLEGAWRRQQIWILVSPRALDRDSAGEAVRGGRIPEGVRVFTYPLPASS